MTHPGRTFGLQTLDKEIAMGAATKIVTDSTFDTDVLGSDKPVLVDFWAERGGPCKMVAPVLEEIASEHGDQITIAKANIAENPEIARRYQIMSIPTMSVFSGGEVVRSIVGAKPKAALLRDLEGILYPHRPRLSLARPVSTGPRAATIRRCRCIGKETGVRSSSTCAQSSAGSACWALRTTTCSTRT